MVVYHAEDRGENEIEFVYGGDIAGVEGTRTIFHESPLRLFEQQG